MVTVDLHTQPGRKQKIWQDAIAWHFGDADLAIRRPERFVGEICSLGNGPIKLVQVKSDNEIGIRTRRHVSRDTDEYFVIAMVNRGKVEFQQRNRSCLLSDGMITIFEVSEPYVIRHDEPADVINLTVPAALFRSFLRRPHERVCQAINTHGVVGKVARDLLVGLAEMGKSGSEIPYASLQLALGGITVLIESADTALSGLGYQRAMALERCKDIVDAHLTEAELGPKYLARKTGLSVRYVHSLFHAAGTTVCEHILGARLSRSLRALGDPANKPVRLKEIAFGSGFANQSYFSAQFRRQYGKTPRQMREILAGKHGA